MSAFPLRDVYDLVKEERRRQDAKWGVQKHPNGTGPDLYLNNLPVSIEFSASAYDLREWAIGRTDREHSLGRGTYEQIFTEEWAEVLAAKGDDEVQRELIHAIAVGVAWWQKVEQERRQAKLDALTGND